MIVMAVGVNSFGGAIQEAVKKSQEDNDFKTPLELKLSDITHDIGRFGLTAAILTFIALLVKLLYSKISQWQFHSNSDTHKSQLTCSSSFDPGTPATASASSARGKHSPPVCTDRQGHRR